MFNAVPESIMRKVKYKWETQKVGVKVGTDMLTNLRFADDLLLIGRSRAQVRHMLEDLAKEAAKVGENDAIAEPRPLKFEQQP